MGIEDGETCCVVCYAAPWMPIVEQRCGASATQTCDNDERDDAIERMYNDGYPIRDIAREMRVSNEAVSCIARARCVLRSASKRAPIRACTVDHAIARQTAGDTLEAIAAELGVGYSQLRQRLLRRKAADARKARSILPSEA
jgi:transposase-like protein